MIDKPVSGECLRQKKIIGYLKWVINFWISEVNLYEETMEKQEKGELSLQKLDLFFQS